MTPRRPAPDGTATLLHNLGDICHRLADALDRFGSFFHDAGFDQDAADAPPIEPPTDEPDTVITLP